MAVLLYRRRDELPGDGKTIMPHGEAPILWNRDPQTGCLRWDASRTPMAHGEDIPTYDLIVIGGGINGSGIARDAALRGLKVLLLEKEDFGAGTSAYSSRLIHGGLRYLANLELDLVRESLQERELLLQNAPHLVRPLALGIPIYTASRNPRWMVWLGMMLYDLLSAGKRMPKHCMYNREAFLRQYPGVNPDGLVGGPVYYDAQAALPERICVENAIAACHTGNATVLNHVEVTQLLRDGNILTGVVLTDRLTGRLYTATGQVIVNAAGPWTDWVLQRVQEATAVPQARRIGGTKGSHIVVRKFPDGPETALYVEARSDGRPFFIIPWREAYYLIGTTDLPDAGDPDTVAADWDEVTYLLNETNFVLPQARLTQSDVLYTYSGIRPLPYTEGKSAGKITRKHWIVDHGKEAVNPVCRLISVIGGKLTTYRNLAEETVDYCLSTFRLLLPQDKPVSACVTREMPLPGGQGVEDIVDYKRQQALKASSQYGISEDIVSHLIDLYGSRYAQVLRLTQENQVWKESLHQGAKDIAAQVIFAVRSELAWTVSDVLLRRLGCGLDDSAGMAALEPVARLMATELGWSEEKIRMEMDAYTAYVQTRNLAFRHEPGKKACPVS
jgi:glycerol-3-phosphate dehydrogenase